VITAPELPDDELEDELEGALPETPVPDDPEELAELLLVELEPVEPVTLSPTL
jgi:hypothetical protein